MSKRQQKKLARKAAAKEHRREKKQLKKEEVKLKAAEKRKAVDERIRNMSPEEREAYKQKSHAANQVCHVIESASLSIHDDHNGWGPLAWASGRERQSLETSSSEGCI